MFRAWITSFLLVPLPLLAACGASDTQCDCPPQPEGVIIQAQPGRILSVTLSGVACATGKIRCVPNDYSNTFTAGCEQYQVLPSRAGNCRVDVQLSEGVTKSTEVEIVDRTKAECCGGMLAADPEKAVFSIPPRSAGG